MTAPSRGRARWWPLGTLAIVAALTIAYVLDVGSRPKTGFASPLLPGRYVLDGLHPRWWHFLSYAFIHANRRHLDVDLGMIGFGCLWLEWRLGPARTVAGFVALTIGVAAVFHALDSRDLYGASGAAYAVCVCAALAWLPVVAARGWRFAPLIVTAAYATYFELMPALDGRPLPGWQPHVIGLALGAVGGAAIVALTWRGAARQPRR